MSRISETQKTIDGYAYMGNYQSITSGMLIEIAKSLAVIADHFTAEDEYMKKNITEAFSDLLFQTNKTGEPSKE